MPESEQQEKMLSETIAKEAVGLGMKTPLRDSILEAVDEAEGTSGGGSSLPLAGLLFGAGAALGFLAGRQSPDLEEASLEDIEEPDIIEDVVEERTGGESAPTEMTADSEESDESEGGSSRLPQLLLAVGLIAGAAVLRRRFSSSEEEEEWEPIEEFEPATSDDLEEEEAEEEEEEEMEAEADEGEETEE